MKFTLISLFALVSVALAVTESEHNGKHKTNEWHPSRHDDKYILTCLP